MASASPFHHEAPQDSKRVQIATTPASESCYTRIPARMPSSTHTACLVVERQTWTIELHAHSRPTRPLQSTALTTRLILDSLLWRRIRSRLRVQEDSVVYEPRDLLLISSSNGSTVWQEGCEASAFLELYTASEPHASDRERTAARPRSLNLHVNLIPSGYTMRTHCDQVLNTSYCRCFAKLLWFPVVNLETGDSSALLWLERSPHARLRAHGCFAALASSLSLWTVES